MQNYAICVANFAFDFNTSIPTVSLHQYSLTITVYIDPNIPYPSNLALHCILMTAYSP